MLKLNRLTDYAVVVMAQMAHRAAAGKAGHGEPVLTAPTLARDSGVPLPTVAKVLTQLARANLVTSHRGVAGGYELARAAEEISMAEIIAALEGPIALTACVDGAESSCDVESLCPMRGNWNKVNSAIREALAGVKLTDMMSFDQFNPFIAADQPGRLGGQGERIQ